MNLTDWRGGDGRFFRSHTNPHTQPTTSPPIPSSTSAASPQSPDLPSTAAPTFHHRRPTRPNPGEENQLVATSGRSCSYLSRSLATPRPPSCTTPYLPPSPMRDHRLPQPCRRRSEAKLLLLCSSVLSPQPCVTPTSISHLSLPPLPPCSPTAAAV
jgi:hypothetical protein